MAQLPVYRMETRMFINSPSDQRVEIAIQSNAATAQKIAEVIATLLTRTFPDVPATIAVSTFEEVGRRISSEAKA